MICSASLRRCINYYTRNALQLNYRRHAVLTVLMNVWGTSSQLFRSQSWRSLNGESVSISGLPPEKWSSLK